MLSRLKKALRFDRLAHRPPTVQEQDEETVHRLRALGVRIGEGCRIYAEDFSTEPYLVTLGDDVNIAGGVKFLTHNGAARLLKAQRPRIQSFGRITIGSHCFIGENVLLLPGTTIGANCIIGAGAVVRGKIADNSLVFGNPGRIVGRASTFLHRLEKSSATLDTFGLAEDARRAMILAHLSEGAGLDDTDQD